MVDAGLLEQAPLLRAPAARRVRADRGGRRVPAGDPRALRLEREPRDRPRPQARR